MHTLGGACHSSWFMAYAPPPCWPSCMRRATPSVVKTNLTIVIPACEFFMHAMGSVVSSFLVAQLPAYPRGVWLGMPAGWVAGHASWVGGWACQLGGWLGMPAGWVAGHASWVGGGGATRVWGLGV